MYFVIFSYCFRMQIDRMPMHGKSCATVEGCFVDIFAVNQMVNVLQTLKLIYGFQGFLANVGLEISILVNCLFLM